MVLTWEAKVIAAAAAADAAAETNWKHKVTPDWGDLINDTQWQHFLHISKNIFRTSRVKISLFYNIPNLFQILQIRQRDKKRKHLIQHGSINHHPNSIKTWFCSQPKSSIEITTKVCIWHDSCRDLMIRIWITAKLNFYQIWIVNERKLFSGMCPRIVSKDHGCQNGSQP